MPELTLQDVLDGTFTMRDLRITAEALRYQASVAAGQGRPQLSANFQRAAELVGVPDDEILAIYNALRPGRATQEELERIAQRMERDYNAPGCASLIREAAGLR